MAKDPKTSTEEPVGEARLGRKRDPSRDADILDATLDVLAEVGLNGFTMDLVAARARAGKGTIYRRWSSKGELIVDAVGHMKRAQVDLERLPDTGTLRADLLALYKPEPVELGERKLRIMASLAAMMSSENEALATAANAAIVEPWASAHHRLMSRARDRGEISRAADIDTLSQIVASMAAYRALVQRKPFELEFLVTMVDKVLLPALKYEPTHAELSAGS
ncbi:Transcriptional regulator, TetR family protein [Enhygromyxa salina]|uniref:Transcriptional regulator, TetR family protein n=1 Tax=Enhygromyxa salina TaxID=215803 RepID=A0A0C2CVG0_9BACT|nr:TetR/AcrR family transcriptional regulator [Enhygromyxa salina]KIG15091.1 Transcriptional regulator, TetR family protein [Enhygromyxa salina]